PWVLVVGFMVLSLSLLVQGLRMKAEEEKSRPVLNTPAVWGLVFFGIYLALLPHLGFLISTPPFFLGLMWLAGERRPLFLAGFSVAIPLFVYAVFQHGFQILLPAYAL
ncbi:MAG: tripartite tricarboxylate transporter TctB family protein, partial [bacterium]|nr:tripartite tricarboxylate transporter TctB family protein [bacterium]